MSQTKVVKVGKKGAIYLPTSIMRELGVREGDRAILRVKEGRVILEFIQDPLSLALSIKPWAETTVEEFERESEEEQCELYG